MRLQISEFRFQIESQIECREELRFTLEARQPVGVLREAFGQHLEGNLALQPRVARAIDRKSVV